MFRSCHTWTSACMVNCKSLPLMIRSIQNRNNGRREWIDHPLQQFFMVKGEKGDKLKHHHPTKGLNNACVFRETHSERCPLQYSSNDTLSEHLALSVVNIRQKHMHSVDEWKTKLNSNNECLKSYPTTFLNGNFNTSYALSKTACSPYQVGWNNHVPQISQTCNLHRQVPRQAVLEDCLSAENEMRCRLHLQPNIALYETDSGKSSAAVLVSLCTVAGEPSFLFTLRSSKLRGKHKGDVSFAGGKRDPSDMNIVETALREAREELGISVTKDDVWGVMKPLNDSSGMKIAPVLANLGPLETLILRPNPSEVEEIFTLTVAHVCNPLNQGYTHFRTGNRFGYTLPVFHNNKYRIWGLTAVALEQTLKLVMHI